MESSPSATQHRDRFYTRCFALGTCVAVGLALYRIFAPFLGPLIWAIFLAFLLHPLQVRLTRRLGNRPQSSALVLTLLTFLLFIGPLTALSAAFAAQVGELLRFVQTTLADPTKSNVLDLANVPWVQAALTRLE